MDKNRLLETRARFNATPGVALSAVAPQEPARLAPVAVPVTELDPLAWSVIQSIPKQEKTAPVAPSPEAPRNRGVVKRLTAPAVVPSKPINSGAVAGAGLALGGALVMLGGLVRSTR
jgi:hypothetical protein